MRDLMLAEFPFLTSLAASESAKDRSVWLRVAVDHFVATAPHDAEGIEKFGDAVTAQLERAGERTRLETSRTLAACPHAPPQLLQKLEASDPDVRAVILEHAVAYTQEALARAAMAGTKEAAAVARRKDLSRGLTLALASANDVEILLALARNARAPVTGPALAKLAGSARRLAERHGDPRLAALVLARKPVEQEAATLFLQADSAQRIAILIAAQRASLGRPDIPWPSGSEAVEVLEKAAVARRPDRLVRALAEALKCELDLARRVVDDESGEPLAVALAALGAPDDVVVRVLISKDLLAGRGYRRIRALARLQSALTVRAASYVAAAMCDRLPPPRQSDDGRDSKARAQANARPVTPVAARPKRALKAGASA